MKAGICALLIFIGIFGGIPLLGLFALEKYRASSNSHRRDQIAEAIETLQAWGEPVTADNIEGRLEAQEGQD
jgi:hypothetical protein